MFVVLSRSLWFGVQDWVGPHRLVAGSYWVTPPERYVQHRTHDAAQLDMGGLVCVGSVDIGEEDAGGDAGLWVRSPPRFKVFPLLGCGDVHGDAGAVVHPQCRRIEAGCVAGLELHRQSSGRFTLDRCIDQERWAS